MEYGEKTLNLTFVKSLWKQMILRTDMASKINPLLKIGIGKEIVVEEGYWPAVYSANQIYTLYWYFSGSVMNGNITGFFILSQQKRKISLKFQKLPCSLDI